MARNPVLWIAIGVPLVAVLASFVTLGMALVHPDGELPEQYHWEGFRLDRDFERAARAQQLGISVRLEGLHTTGRCTASLQTRGPLPSSLLLTVTHGTLPELDRRVQLARTSASADGTSAVYEGRCIAAPDGSWRLELTDSENGWSLRQSVRGSLDAVQLEAIRRGGG